MPSLSVHDLGSYLREQRESARLSVRQLSELAGVSNPYLSQIERGLKKPSAEILGQLAKGLRISAESLYVRAGILDEREDQMAVESAIVGDSGLSERQKRVLLDIYETFRAENARETTHLSDSPPQASPSKTSPPQAAPSKAAPKQAPPKKAPRAGATKRAAKSTQKKAAAAGKTAVRSAPMKGKP